SEQVADALKPLADAYRGRGRWDEGERLYRRILAIWQRRPDRWRGHTLALLGELAWDCREQGRYAVAAALLQERAALEQAGQPSEAYPLANDLRDLAELARLQGQAGEAETLLGKAV